MKTLFTSMCVLCLVVFNTARAQDDKIKNFTTDDFEKFVKDDLKKEVEKAAKQPEGGATLYQIKGGFQALYNPKKKSLTFFEKYIFELDFDRSKKTQDENLKVWNDKKGLSRAILTGKTRPGDDAKLYPRRVAFEGHIDFTDGISRSKLKTFYNDLDGEFDNFILFMQGMKKDGTKK